MPTLRAPLNALGVRRLPRQLPPVAPARAYSDKPEDIMKKLYASFSDPTSPYYLAPGEVGPASPDPPFGLDDNPTPLASYGITDFSKALYPHDSAHYTLGRLGAVKFAREEGWGLGSVVEWPVAWGEMDQFRHINNAAYARYFETARVKVMQSLEPHLSPTAYREMTMASGMGFVIKSVLLNYIRPVTFPDTLVMLTKPTVIDQGRASFSLDQAAWSLSQNALVAKCESVHVMYDFPKLKKGAMSDEFKAALEAIKAEGEASQAS